MAMKGMLGYSHNAHQAHDPMQVLTAILWLCCNVAMMTEIWTRETSSCSATQQLQDESREGIACQIDVQASSG